MPRFLFFFCFFFGAQNPILQVGSLGLAFASAAYLMGMGCHDFMIVINIIHVDA